MARTLDKQQSRQRISEMRVLWNEWDPIGVVKDSVDDEYNAYLAPAVRLLERNAPIDEIVQYLKWVTDEQMGLSLTSGHERFAERLKEWFSTKWAATRIPGV
jgi:hypothetical protein